MTTPDEAIATLEAERDRLRAELAARPVGRPVLAPPTNVIAALARVIAEMPGVGKDQTMSSSSGSYKYRGIEAITAAAQHLLGRHGIVIVPRVEQRTVAEITMGGKPWTEDTMHVVFRIYGPGGRDDFVEAGPFIALARDNSDKGTNKGMTQAFKQMLLQVLCVGDNNDDPDSYAAQDRDTTPVWTPDSAAQAGGWESALEQENAKQSARQALSARVERDEITRERAAELFREYQHPDGEGEGAAPRLRTRTEHLAWWGHNSGAVTAGEDNPLDPAPPVTPLADPEPPIERHDRMAQEIADGAATITAEAPEQPQEPPKPSTPSPAPEPAADPSGPAVADNGFRDGLDALYEATMAKAKTTGDPADVDRLIEEIRDMPISEVADRLQHRGAAQPSGTAAQRRRRLAEHVIHAYNNDHPGEPAG